MGCLGNIGFFGAPGGRELGLHGAGGAGKPKPYCAGIGGYIEGVQGRCDGAPVLESGSPGWEFLGPCIVCMFASISPAGY